MLATLSVCFAMSLSAQSTKEYTEDLVVTVNDESTEPQSTTVTVETLENGNINFTLKNFKLTSADGSMYVGNIAVEDIALTDEGYCKSFSYNGNITINEGDEEGVEMWLGPMLGEVPLNLTGKMTDDDLYVTIDIDMSATLEQIIYVKLGDDIVEPEGPTVVSSKEYTEDLVVSVNDERTDPQSTTVTVETLDNGNINFTLKNFKLASEDGSMYVGNIAVEDIALTDEGYCKTFSYTGNIVINEGDDPDAPFWLGPMLGEVPLNLTGKMTDDKLYVTIDIDMSATLEQIIYVKLGDDIIDPATAIKSVEVTANDNAIYDLSGRKVTTALKGNVYIMNGKKIIK